MIDDPPYEMKGSVTPVQGDDSRHAADDDEDLEPEDRAQSRREQGRARVAREYGGLETPGDEHEIGDEHGGGPEQPELIGDHRIDHVGARSREQEVVGTRNGQRGLAEALAEHTAAA